MQLFWWSSGIAQINPGFEAKKPRPTRGYESVSNSEEVDAEDAGARTPCGWPAAMDLAPAPKAISQMNLRNCPNGNPGPEEKNQDQ